MEGLKLLVVEDDVPSLELMTEIFASLKAKVHPVADSQRAAILVNQEKFDGIFLDLEMPKIHGLELARKIRQSSWNKTTPIIVVTGRDRRDTMQEVFAAGATFYLQKPIDRQKLSGLFRTVRGTLSENRRRGTRVPMQTNFSCSVGSRTMRGQTWNLSLGGMQVEASGLQPGDSVRLSFHLPASSNNIDVFGNVVWAKADRQGIQFAKMTSQNQNEIRQYITQVEQE